MCLVNGEVVSQAFQQVALRNDTPVCVHNVPQPPKLPPLLLLFLFLHFTSLTLRTDLL